MEFGLSSCLLKLDRALEHLKVMQAVDLVVIDKARVHEGLAEKKFNRKQKCWVFTAKGLVGYPPTAGPVVGDYLNNLRSALDHLAWQLVLNGDKPHPKNPEPSISRSTPSDDPQLGDGGSGPTMTVDCPVSQGRAWQSWRGISRTLEGRTFGPWPFLPACRTKTSTGPSCPSS